MFGPALIVLVNRHLAAGAARKKAKAKFLRDEANADPVVTPEDREKLLEAAQLEAEAEALQHPNGR